MVQTKSQVHVNEKLELPRVYVTKDVQKYSFVITDSRSCNFHLSSRLINANPCLQVLMIKATTGMLERIERKILCMISTVVTVACCFVLYIEATGVQETISVR